MADLTSSQEKCIAIYDNELRRVIEDFGGTVVLNAISNCSSVASFPIANVYDKFVSYPFKVEITNQALAFSFAIEWDYDTGNSGNNQCFLISNHNLDLIAKDIFSLSSSTIAIQYNNGGWQTLIHYHFGTTSPLVGFELTENFEIGDIFKYYESDTGYQEWRILFDISAPTSSFTEDYVEIGELLIGRIGSTIANYSAYEFPRKIRKDSDPWKLKEYGKENIGETTGAENDITYYKRKEPRISMRFISNSDAKMFRRIFEVLNPEKARKLPIGLAIFPESVNPSKLFFAGLYKLISECNPKYINGDAYALELEFREVKR